MMIKRIRRLWRWRAIGLAVVVLVFAGCTGGKEHKDLGAGTESATQHAMFDRDSRNNEDNSLGVKAKWLKDQAVKPDAETEKAEGHVNIMNQHLTRTLRFAPEIANHIEQLPGVKQATVLITEANAYAAIVMDGHDADVEGHPDMMAHQITPKGGVGLFGSGKGIAVSNWSDPGGLGHAMSSRISGQIITMTQPTIKQVYVSANPNFVKRLHFYEKESQSGVELSAYMNELNTMIQRVFPNFNTRK
jgi:hypothetical protein